MILEQFLDILERELERRNETVVNGKCHDKHLPIQKVIGPWVWFVWIIFSESSTLAGDDVPSFFRFREIVQLIFIIHFLHLQSQLGGTFCIQT